MTMKLAAVMLVLCSTLAFGKSDIPITGVVVFSGRAQVTRSARLDLKAGATVLDLEGLPWELEESSVRVVIDGGAGAVLRRVEIEPVFSRLVREEEAAKLKDQVAALKAAVHDLSKRAETLRRQIAFLGTFEVTSRPHAADQPPLPVAINPKSWMGVLDFVSDGLAGAFKQLDEIDKESDERARELELLSTRLERLSSKDVKRYKNVYVHLAADREARATVGVSYMVPGPQWFPRYEARADVSGGKVTLNAYALVRQETGEDWKGAAITVSTVDLSVSASLPALVTDRISAAGIMHIQPAVSVLAAPPATERAEAASGDVSKGRPNAPPGLLPADAAQRERDSLSALQGELVQQRASLSQVRQASAAGKGAGAQPAASSVQRLDAEDAGGRYGKLRGLYRSQQAALQTRDYGAFSAMNKDIVQLVNTLPPGEQTALNDMAEEASGNVAKAQRLMKSEKLEKGLVSPQASAAGVDFRFPSIGPANVYSEWVLTKVPYLEVEVPVGFAYESAPVLSQLFYLIGTGNNPLDRPLLAGPMAVFVGPDFMGESVLEKRPSGSKLRFELGIDREVEIRRQIERRRDTAGLLRKRYHHTYDVTLYAVNRKPAPVETLIVDRIPYRPENETAVDVKELSAEPKPDKSWDGLLQWRMKLAPGEKREIRFSYELSHRSTLALVAGEGGVLW